MRHHVTKELVPNSSVLRAIPARAAFPAQTCKLQAQVQVERDLAVQIEEEAAGAVEELETELEACRLSAEREIEQARREAADAAGRASSSAARWQPCTAFLHIAVVHWLLQPHKF